MIYGGKEGILALSLPGTRCLYSRFVIIVLIRFWIECFQDVFYSVLDLVTASFRQRKSVQFLMDAGFISSYDSRQAMLNGDNSSSC